MSQNGLAFNCAVITGGGGGIGRALAEYLISKGKKVLLAGRTESNLKSTTQEIGAAGEHPELDCLINNAGVQRPIDVLKNDDFLEKADQEIDINIRGPMHLSFALIPHFKTKPNALIVNITSGLAYIPFSVINPVYNGTKAWLHFFSMNLRTQLKNTKIRVVEIAPPMVESNLHRERENPDDNKKEHAPHTLTMEEFMGEIVPKFEKGDDTIGAGMAAKAIDTWYGAFGGLYEGAAKSYI
ncbi:related to oxidoreductase [Fusarium fujikuroi IMI 58289]|uniref:Related to oxidoreductase n=1 Tax=Gibberella fujikuroi (strain CBS 195.34 / IMI 58289 / NRRL A-6831) TaxID=1279085 RepID=S0EPE3_GIBF5|nr:related to oxidoreductase [Fusarium fujikuroi IMI 58289]CCT74968.1 related to oxidoreductase [Fusarium fujikuroi IMI 58289]SCO04093.1 related to oxidoreductase [Fusarium fujikuroi]